jgi:glutaredoxin 3
MTKIEVYTKEFCPYCTRAKQLLRCKSVSFEEIDINLNPERKEEMIERSNGRLTVPQIFINGECIGGCDDLFALENAGKLDAKLARS